MSGFTLVKTVAAPREKVFAVFGDFENAARHVTGIETLEILGDGKVGKGTRFRETRIMFKKEATEEMEITSWNPPESYTVSCESCGCLYTSSFEFKENGAGTEVRVVIDTEALTFLAKLCSPLTFLMKGTMKKCFQGDLDDLERVALET